MRISRRDFIRLLGGGTAWVGLPALSGCYSRSQLVGGAGELRAGGLYFEGFGVDAALLGRILARGLARGGDFSEVFLQHRVVHSLGLEDGQINRAYSLVELGAGIRVLKGDATGYAFSEELSESALMSAADTAASIADGPAGVRARGLALTRVESRYPVAVPWSEVGIEKKLPVLARIEGLARGADPRVVKVTVSVVDETNRILVAHSEGLLVEDCHPMVQMSVSCVAQHKGRTETGGKSFSGRDGLDFLGVERQERLARKAVENTVLLFDAVAAPVGELPVVMAPGESGILLHEAMGHGFEADFNRKGVSIYADRMGSKVAPDFVHISDDATVGRSRGSINVDDEGTVGQKTVLVENGVLRSYLHDRISARHYGVGMTGNGRRQSFRYAPLPRMRSTYMAAGPHKPEEIIASVKRGLYAESFTNGQVQIGAGDFTFYLKHGRLIEDGKLTGVVKDVNLIGSGPKVLEAVQMVGDDPAMENGGGMCGKDGQMVPVSYGLPTVRIGAVSIGGRKA